MNKRQSETAFGPGAKARLFKAIVKENRERRDENARLRERLEAPVPMRLPCPACGRLHVDGVADGTDWSKKPHHTHACQACGEVWRPAIVNTVGVQFLPGFKNDRREP